MNKTLKGVITALGLVGLIGINECDNSNKEKDLIDYSPAEYIGNGTQEKCPETELEKKFNDIEFYAKIASSDSLEYLLNLDPKNFGASDEKVEFGGIVFQHDGKDSYRLVGIQYSFLTEGVSRIYAHMSRYSLAVIYDCDFSEKSGINGCRVLCNSTECEETRNNYKNQIFMSVGGGYYLGHEDSVDVRDPIIEKRAKQIGHKFLKIITEQTKKDAFKRLVTGFSNEYNKQKKFN